MPDIDELLAALEEFDAHSPPECLYRFYGPGAISALTHGKLKVTPPLEFNDPFEVWVGLSPEPLTEEGVLRSVFSERSLFRLSMLENIPGYDLQGIGFEERLTQAIKQDPKIWREQFKSQVTAIASSFAERAGVACFSGFSEQEFYGELGIHHWAMYADSHRGFAITYDGTHPLIQAWANAKWLFQVDYVERRHTVRLSDFDEWSDRKMWKAFRRWTSLKARGAWEHEREWRLLCSIGMPLLQTEVGRDGKLLHFLPLWLEKQSEDEKTAHASIISAVTLGTRASVELEEKVLVSVQQPHLRHISVFRVRADDTNYVFASNCLHEGDKSRIGEFRTRLVPGQGAASDNQE